MTDVYESESPGSRGPVSSPPAASLSSPASVASRASVSSPDSASRQTDLERPIADRETLPPGSRLPALIQTALLFRDPVGYLESCRRRHGSVFQLRLVGFPRYVFVTDPRLAREVYTADREVARAGEGRRDFLAPVVGESSLLCTEDEQWLRHRKLLGPIFHRNHVDGFAAQIATIAGDDIAGWPRGRPFRLHPQMQAITLEVILRLVFGITDSQRLGPFRELLPRLTDVTGGVLLWLLPGEVWKRAGTRGWQHRIPGPLRTFLALREEVDRLIYEEIAQRRAQLELDGSRTDVLSMLLLARDEEGGAMSDVELRDELITLLLAGHETTATGLAWAFERLLRNPRVLERLLAEIDAGEQDSYQEAVVRETLRSRSVILDTPRLLAGRLELAGYAIPRGWFVSPAIPAVQHDPAVNGEPEEFRPERFLEDPPRDGWIPFGGGKRHCVGSHLALLEMKVVIAEVLRRVRLQALDPAPERQSMRHVTLVPGDGVLVRAQERTPHEQRAQSPILAS